MPVMPLSAIWFIILLLIGLACIAPGWWLGAQKNTGVRIGALIATLGLIVLAAIPRFMPTLLHTTLPLLISIHLEGVLATFPWMILVGLVWAGHFTANLRRAAPLMLVLGIVYFLFGGVWMVLPNIQPDEPEARTDQGLTLQSRGDTCVPAACASALRLMGIETTEAKMCAVVQAKPGRGSTLARAAFGLRAYLAERGITVRLEDFDADEVVWEAQPDRPVLVVIRSNLAADHMVVVLGRLGEGVVIANPSPGVHGGVRPMRVKLNPGFQMYEPEGFARLYRGGAIVFQRKDGAERSLPPP
ncbi:MAG: hypothetical protein SYC29_15815 [Planctomycetota bacterium]|nr:hypothetical protein [Planctomycetota bacterium]